MPELPEVETLRRDLKAVAGRTIARAHVNVPKMVQPLSAKNFSRKVKGQKITGISRRAKMLVFNLSDGNHILVHLKMTGQLIYQPKKGKTVFGGHPQEGGLDNLPNKFTHVIFTFTDGAALYFNDMRKFGWVRHATPQDLQLHQGRYGVEPLSKAFTLDYFRQVLAKYKNRSIKQLLLDQSLIAGLGNIYVDESCFYAKVLPTRRALSLTPAEIKKLFAAIPYVLKLSLANKGTSFSDYVRLDGTQGKMVRWLKVYNKAGQRCSRCGGVVKKIKLNGRGTHFCLLCQK